MFLFLGNKSIIGFLFFLFVTVVQCFDLQKNVFYIIALACCILYKLVVTTEILIRFFVVIILVLFYNTSQFSHHLQYKMWNVRTLSCQLSAVTLFHWLQFNALLAPNLNLGYIFWLFSFGNLDIFKLTLSDYINDSYIFQTIIPT